MKTWKPEVAAAFGGAIGLSLAVGVGTGYLAAGEPITRTPSACHSMADTAIEAFQLWADLASATTDRDYAPDATTRAVHDGEVKHLLASLDAIAPEYDTAAAACLGES